MPYKKEAQQKLHDIKERRRSSSQRTHEEEVVDV